MMDRQNELIRENEDLKTNNHIILKEVDRYKQENFLKGDESMQKDQRI